MCGIATLIEPSAPAWLAATVRAMTRAVRHRGPDGEGLLFINPAAGTSAIVLTEDTPAGINGEAEAPAGSTLGLGHRRLAILDRSSAGFQPMRDSSGGCAITYNGEIYNYVELRADLARLGYTFRSGTDTEVILAAWRHWGEACLARFNGMFAFVLYDRRSRRIFAARDRFGVKPLYYWPTPTGGIALASEIKQFTFHPRWKARLNGQSAYDFLNWGLSDHTGETSFAGVRQLRGGEYLSAPMEDLARAQPQRWYEVQPTPFVGNFDEACGRFRELLDDSVRLRLRSDVPVGSCLSGGLDSSAIVCTLQAQLGSAAASQQSTFSAYSDVARFDERSYIEEVTAATGASPHGIVPSPKTLLEELDRIAWHQDEPFGSTSIFAQWCVFRLARENRVTVMLDGQGADEALGGYHGYFGPRLAGLLRRGHLATCWREAAAIRSLHGQTWQLQAQLIANECLGGRAADLLRLLAGRTVDVPDALNLPLLGAKPGSPHLGSVNLREPLRSLGRAQLTRLTVPMLLRFEDRDSMAHGVEARLPFLDYRLVEFCLGLPECYKMADGWTKRVLRESMRDRLPERVRTRRDKLGFATAEEVWMRGAHRLPFQHLLDQAVDAAGGILTPAARTKATRILAGDEPFSFLPWRIISFGTWLRQFNVDTTSAGHAA